MKICIYGAGAVGSHFAARLANAEHEVSVVARGPHLEAIQRNGITLRSGDQTIQARVTATDRPTQLGTQDLVIVTVKAPALAGIVDGVKQLLDAQTPLIFGMNGIPWWYFHGLDPAGQERKLPRLDPENRWWDEVGPRRVIGGVVYSANEVVEPGVIENRSPGRNTLRVAEPDGSDSERVARVNAVLDEVGLATRTEDLRLAIWEKLLGNIAYGPIACLTGSTVNQILADEGLRSLAAELMTEAIATARALGVDLQASAETRMAAVRSSGHKVSMLQDLERGRAMEVDAIVAVPRQLAHEQGVPTPALDRVLALLAQRARLAGCYDG